MKYLVIFCITSMLILLLLLSACQSDGKTSSTTVNDDEIKITTKYSIPVGEYKLTLSNPQAPDELNGTPGGIAYWANVIQEGVANPWPPIQVTIKQMKSGIDVMYRADIESKAGETHYNIINITKTTGHFENNTLKIYTNTMYNGIGLAVSPGAGLPGSLSAILIFTVSPDIIPGKYFFMIIIEIDGKEYGWVPCTINVIMS
jgi:hypothetical protein